MPSVEYDGVHSITFGDGTLSSDGKFLGKNTWDDWHLIPSSRPTMPMPGFATKYVEIPGRDGAIDLSEFLVKRPVFGDRSGSFEFYVDNTKELDWIDLYHRIASYFHGKRMRMCLSDDPEYYYEGRFALSEWASDASWSRIVLNYQVGPYKMRHKTIGLDDPIWDTFNFNTDKDGYTLLHDISVNNEERTMTLEGSDFPYSITVTCTSGTVTVAFNGDSRTLSSGQSASIGRAKPDTNTLTVSGTGHVQCSFKE